MNFTTKRRIIRIIALILIIAMFVFYNFFTESAAGITLLISLLIAFYILTLIWWRCPGCNAYLWKTSPFAKYCPFCGEKFE